MLEIIINNLFLTIMIILSIIYASWIFLLFWPKRRQIKTNFFPPISIIIPAHNEEENIKSVLESLVSSDYDKKEIIVVDDGSTDRTYEIVKNFSKKHPIKLIRGKHQGKARALNLAMKKTKNDYLVIVDADTTVKEDTLKDLLQPFQENKVAAVASNTRINITRNIITWFQSLEYSISTAWNYICSNIGGLSVMSPVCAFRKDVIEKIGGFKGDTAAEDYDICMIIKKAGYDIKMAPSAIAYNKAPQTLSGWIKQRMRWEIGTFQVIKKHFDMVFNRKHLGVGFYSTPTKIYWYIHSFIYLPVVSYQIFYGYFKYFFFKHIYFSFEVVKYFFYWLTVFGMADYTYKLIIGVYPLDIISALIIFVFVSVTSFIFYSLIKFSDKITIYHLIAFIFFFPYTLILILLRIFTFFYKMKSSNKHVKWEKEK
jgi:cellulose synthase/poly-beta-1,6-N-acetylglucosamine synthase-like glycosyltransferase